MSNKTIFYRRMPQSVFLEGQANQGKLQWSKEDIHQRPLRSLNLPEDWQPLINEITSHIENDKPSKVLVCGPKGSGKSTFCRWLSNFFLSSTRIQRQIAESGDCLFLLDLDPGQPEFSPPGEVSLIELQSHNLGVPFTHPIVSPGEAKVIRAHHIGSASPKENPKHYLQAALDLLQAYQDLRKAATSSLLVINSSGWIQGPGLELLVDMIIRSSLTALVYTSMNGPDEVVDALGEACAQTRCSLRQISSQPYQDAMRNAANLRSMQTVSYFHLTDFEAGNLKWDARPISHKPPMIVPYAGPKQAIFAVMILGDTQNPDLYPSVLNGAVVGLELIEDESAIPEMEKAFLAKENHGNDGEGLSERAKPVDKGGTITDEPASNGLNPVYKHQTKSPNHLSHPSIRHTSIKIPYIPPINKVISPLSPTHTRSLGQALIRSIDEKAHAFHLITPVTPSEVQELHNQNRKIVLVHGKLDTPTWAYKEDLEYERFRSRERERVLGKLDNEEQERTEEDMRGWASRQPWVSVTNGEGKSTGKARRIRRDIRYRGPGDESR